MLPGVATLCSPKPTHQSPALAFVLSPTLEALPHLPLVPPVTDPNMRCLPPPVVRGREPTIAQALYHAVTEGHDVTCSAGMSIPSPITAPDSSLSLHRSSSSLPRSLSVLSVCRMPVYRLSKARKASLQHPPSPGIGVDAERFRVEQGVCLGLFLMPASLGGSQPNASCPSSPPAPPSSQRKSRSAWPMRSRPPGPVAPAPFLG